MATRSIFRHKTEPTRRFSSKVEGAMRCGQECLELLARWCQLISLWPFRLERNGETGAFQRFSCSWRHPLAYWWLLWKMVYVAASVVYVRFKWIIMTESLATERTSAAERLVFTVGTILSTWTFFWVPEVLVFQGSLLSRASQAVVEFDTMLQDVDRPPCSTQKRTVVAIVSVLVVTAWSVGTHHMVVLSRNNWGLYLLDMGLYAHNMLRFFTCLAFLYVCYYSLCHRIWCLKHVLNEAVDRAGHAAVLDAPDGDIAKTRLDVALVHRAFNVLCRAGGRLNGAFSFCGFWLVSFHTAMVIWGGFLVLRRPKEADEESDEYRDSHHQLALSLSWLAIDIACLLTVCVLADLPSRQVKRLRRRLMKLHHRARSDRVKFQITAFAAQVTDDRIRLSAVGIFNVGLHLLPSLAGITVTYLVVLIPTTK